MENNVETSRYVRSNRSFVIVFQRSFCNIRRSVNVDWPLFRALMLFERAWRVITDSTGIFYDFKCSMASTYFLTIRFVYINLFTSKIFNNVYVETMLYKTCPIYNIQNMCRI